MSAYEFEVREMHVPALDRPWTLVVTPLFDDKNGERIPISRQYRTEAERADARARLGEITQ